jgi:hypothetical protein
VLVVAACGGGSAAKQSASTTTPASAPATAISETSYGKGAGQAWVFRPKTVKPRAVVLFFHGLGDQKETTPFYHLPWLAHLAASNIVVYPRYEQYPGARGALRNAIIGINNAVSGAKIPDGLPVVAIGYSRGGGLGFDYAAVAPAVGPIPKAVLEVFPGMQDPALDIRGIAPNTYFVFLVGQDDTVVGSRGAEVLIGILAAAKYPRQFVKEYTVKTHTGFLADHLAPLETTQGAKNAFWRPADQLITAMTKSA